MPLVVRGRHEDGVWKSLPAGHYSQKSKERWAGERKEESGMGVTPGSLTTVKSDKKKKIYWKNYLKILAGNKINKLFDSGFKIGTQWIKHWSHNYLEQGLPTFFIKVIFNLFITGLFPSIHHSISFCIICPTLWPIINFFDFF